jgi:hypothetical protein
MVLVHVARLNVRIKRLYTCVEKMAKVIKINVWHIVLKSTSNVQDNVLVVPMSVRNFMLLFVERTEKCTKTNVLPNAGKT